MVLFMKQLTFTYERPHDILTDGNPIGLFGLFPVIDGWKDVKLCPAGQGLFFCHRANGFGKNSFQKAALAYKGLYVTQ